MLFPSVAVERCDIFPFPDWYPSIQRSGHSPYREGPVFCFTRHSSTSSLSDFRRKSFVFNDSPFQLETVNTVI